MFEDIFNNNSNDVNLINGIVTGTVKEIYDEKSPAMVKAEIFMTDGTVNVTDWMRVIVPYGGKGRGMYFLPEVGDEVAIAFERGDIERPYVIGCLWNNVDTVPEETVKEDNTVKKIRTKSGHEIIFDDTDSKGKISIITAKKMSIVMEDENDLITISAKESDGDTIKIDSKNGEITLTGKKKITMDTGSSKIEIDGNSKKISVNADTINIDGKSIKIKGQTLSIEGTSIDLKASGTMNVKSDGATNVKGGIVKIN